MNNYVCSRTLRAHQQAVVLSWSQVGVAEMTSSLENSNNSLHVASETETAVSHNQQLHN